MLDVMLLALALSMDAFAVSIGLGSKLASQSPQSEQTKPLDLALKAGIYFGLFQVLMPFIGFLGGHGVLGWIEGYASWIAFILLFFIGAKMIYEAFSEGIEDDICQVTHRIMLTLAIATSVDAMAAGFSLPLLDVNPFVACAIIGIVTFIFSFIGVFIGRKSGTWLESKAELAGGIVLILIAFKLLLV
ncbi:manganese efflux pump [Vibrio sp. S11_S32]|uniref:manganese efflux pump MntP n=1 Tax=Vibrio sp. S11_S32 TaxID=2720225 RepID=UPI0016813FB6|nr:manganese efflux pump MntP family protein [Vibrio sp. S11_S32]MBD1576426.1 manganese efflux pump [Vibrio sp. S11_S32]